MAANELVFAQLMECVPRHDFNACVKRYRGDHRLRRFSCRDQFLCMAFAQLTFRDSLRDIETCLRSLQPKLYRAGFRSRMSRSTLADANRLRDWRIYRDLAQILIAEARSLYAGEPLGFELAHTVYALDATTIDLCLTLFPWAPSMQSKAGVRLHTLLDLRGNIPVFIRISTAKMHEVRVLDELPIERNAFYVMDKAYIDFSRLYRMHQHGAFFVTRHKKDHAFTCHDRQRVDKTTGVRSDQRIRFNGPRIAPRYPADLRRIAFYDSERKKRLVFITNNFDLPSLSVALLYRKRWHIELFFKWIKQHLKITAFLGNSDNAVRTQIWIAVSVYVLVAIVRRRLDCKLSMADVLQVLSVNVFEKTEINTLFSQVSHTSNDDSDRNQLRLFDF
jgi:hypothetical protein